MNARMINRIEAVVEQLSATFLAGAVGYAAYEASGERLLYGACGSAAACLLCLLVMRAATGGRASFPIQVFDVGDLAAPELDELLLTEKLGDELVLTQSDRLDAELVLTDADRLRDGIGTVTEPLILDDVLAAVDADARVVRLFDRKAMPTPGQMSSSIERHLDRGTGSPHPDAAQALSDALAELRRSLR